MYGVPGFGINNQSLISRELFLQNIDSLHSSLDDVSIQAIIFQYSDWTDVNNETKNRDFLGQIITDSIFICVVQDFGARYERLIEPLSFCTIAPFKTTLKY